jgi:hypothetical protein
MLGMLSEFTEPFLNVIESLGLCNVVNKKSSHSVSIVGIGDGSVPFLPGSVPDLSPNLLIFNLNVPGREFHSNGGLRILLKLVLCVAKKQVRFSDP